MTNYPMTKKGTNDLRTKVDYVRGRSPASGGRVHGEFREISQSQRKKPGFFSQRTSSAARPLRHSELDIPSSLGISSFVIQLTSRGPGRTIRCAGGGRNEDRARGNTV
jgi:hypothetical protein